MTRPERIFDIECYPNYFLVKFMDRVTRQIVGVHMTPTHPLDIARIRAIIAESHLIGFNSMDYDVPMLSAALAGMDNAALKWLNDRIIIGGLKYWEFHDVTGIPRIDGLMHTDIMDVAPGVKISLKMYGARMHSRKLQDLPYDPALPVNAEQMRLLSEYCDNDLQTTDDLLREIEDRLALRDALGEKYGINVRSKSDAQISEAIIKSQVKSYINKAAAVLPHGFSFRYEAPKNIRFGTPQLQNILHLVQSVDFFVADYEEEIDGEKYKVGVRMPPELKKLVITIGHAKYKMGIGGLHSQEQKQVLHTIPGVVTYSDHDVTGYYPSMITLMNIEPPALNGEFQSIYKEIVATRRLAKKEGRKTEADGLKIVNNGAFGKLFSRYSIFFYPQGGIKTTLSGQLYLLMLIERLTECGLRVMSANTDGIVVETPAGLEWLRDEIMDQWQRETGLDLEMNIYRSLWQRDVNNYIARPIAGDWKRKGAYGASGVLAGPSGKHPHKDICNDAVIAYLEANIPIDHTIRACKDIRKFICVRNVRGGAVWRDQYLGKAVRWYYARGINEAIHYKTNGNMVAGSTGAMPIMELDGTFPPEIDYDHYISDAKQILVDIGLKVP